MKKFYTVFVLMLVIAMLLPACATPATPAPATEVPATAVPATEVPATVAPATEVPATVAPTAEVVKFKVGEVSDFGGVNDKSFNQLAWDGVQKANTDLGTDGKFLESKVQSDYAKNIQQFVSEGSNMVVTVGFNMGIDTATAAKANPNALFAIVDYSYPDCFSDTAVEGKDCGSKTEMTNARGLVFQTDEAAFLAGYAAAGFTKTGTVATFGGLPFPSVTIFMKGFEAGVKHYNAIHGTKVKLLGWDTAKGEGTFVNNFDSTDDGRKTAESFAQEGADIILPVAGPVGLGSAAYCKETSKCLIIGVDADFYLTAPEYQSVIFTSVLKKVDVAVFSSIKDAVDGKFTGGTMTYALKDGGVDIAPFHDFDSQISAALKAELEQLKKDIISGTITVDGVLGIKK
jgi:basic membrane protein A